MSRTGDKLARAKAYLYQLGTEEVEPNAPYSGVCHNLYVATNIHIVSSEETGTYDDWPHYSGNYLYPLPGGKTKYNSIRFLDKWHGEQGKLRRDLCLFLADNLKPHQIY